MWGADCIILCFAGGAYDLDNPEIEVHVLCGALIVSFFALQVERTT